MSDLTVWQLHDAADRNGEDFYVDPDTGYRVFTAHGLRQRGSCCGSGCRHCPFDHARVDIEDRARRAQQPAWLTGREPTDAPVDVLFWSGGKDSFLAYRALERAGVRDIALLTTFDAETRVVAHQEVAVDLLVRQADALDVPLLGIPLHPGLDYVNRVADGLRLVPAVARLVFGDLHLEHIRAWREDAFRAVAAARGASLHFPLWHTPYATLIDDLEASGIACAVTAVTGTAGGAVRVGDNFDRAFMTRLPAAIDGFGENGEFHTLAKLWA